MASILYAAILICFSMCHALNEDQLRDEANYALHLRSRRAICEKPVPITNQCRRCNCNWRFPPHPIISKRAVDASASKLGLINPIRPIWPTRPACYYKCCIRTVSKSGTLSSAGLKSMASGLVAKFGKRGDIDFKKPSVDLVFLIDDSGSIPESQFQVAKDGASKLSKALCPHKYGQAKGDKQVAVALFSTTAKTIMTFKQSREGAEYIDDAIQNMQQRAGATSTADALKHVRENILGKDGSRLNDPDTATIVFVITDGKCNDECHRLKSEAKKLRESGPGVQVFAFGVGEADCQELEDIRGTDAGEVYGLPDYNLFEKLAQAVEDEVKNSSC